MDIESWEQEVEAALVAQGLDYEPKYRGVMLSETDPTTNEKNKPWAADVTIAMEREFWKRVVEQKTFGDLGRIKQEFDKSLEQNYGLSSGPFMDLARAFWTYKIEVDDLSDQHYKKWITKALLAVEINIAGIFFPTPGPAKIYKWIRRSMQKKYLKEFAPQLDIRRLIKENPYL